MKLSVSVKYIGFRQLYRFQANCRKPKDLPETETLPETEKLPETESIPKFRVFLKSKNQALFIGEA